MNKIKAINIVFLATVAASFLGSFVNEFIGQFTGNSYLVRLLVGQIILIIPTLLYIVIYHLNIKETIRFHGIKWSNVILIIVFAYLIMPLMTLLSAISMLFATNTITDAVNEVVTSNPLVISLFAIAFVPAILEESVYRGIFYNEYRKANPWKGILLSGLLFGLLHMNFNQFIYAFVMGMIFALLIEATDSILASMIVHFVINGTSVVGTYILPKLNEFLQKVTGQEQTAIDTNALTAPELVPVIRYYAAVSVITTILAVIVYRNIAKNSGRFEVVMNMFKGNKRDRLMENNIKYSDEGNIISFQISNQRFITIPLIIGMVICLGIMIYTEVIF